jgi:hypothetical protein
VVQRRVVSLQRAGPDAPIAEPADPSRHWWR